MDSFSDRDKHKYTGAADKAFLIEINTTGVAFLIKVSTGVEDRFKLPLLAAVKFPADFSFYLYLSVNHSFSKWIPSVNACSNFYK